MVLFEHPYRSVELPIKSEEDLKRLAAGDCKSNGGFGDVLYILGPDFGKKSKSLSALQRKQKQVIDLMNK